MRIVGFTEGVSFQNPSFRELEILFTMMYLCSLRTNISERASYPRYIWEAEILAAQPMDQREFETLQYYLKEYGQQAEVFAGQLELMENGRMEAFAAIEALEALVASDDGTVLLQIGAGASLRAKILEPEKVLLNIGSDVIVEKTNPDAVGYLKDRITEMEASQKKVAEALEKLKNQMNEIAKRLEQGYSQAAAPESHAGHNHNHAHDNEENDEE
jgi:prefoldin alpha subunit